MDWFISFINWRFNCYHQASDGQDSSVAVWLCSNHAKDVGGESEMIWPEIETQVKTPNALSGFIPGNGWLSRTSQHDCERSWRTALNKRKHGIIFILLWRMSLHNNILWKKKKAVESCPFKQIILSKLYYFFVQLVFLSACVHLNIIWQISVPLKMYHRIPLHLKTPHLWHCHWPELICKLQEINSVSMSLICTRKDKERHRPLETNHVRNKDTKKR